jgi:ribonuclease Z
MTLQKKLLLGLMLLILIAFALLKGFQAQIGTALFERAVSSRVGSDSTAGLADSLHVGLCGTGSPLPNADRAGACTVVIAGKRVFVVDAGEGGARNIQLMGINPGRIERLFLTHFHSDHIDGLGPMMLFRWTGSAATAPLPVHGPDGVQAVIAGFNAAYTADNGYRVAHHGADIVPPEGGGATAVAFEMTADSAVVFDEGGVKVTAFRVDHKPVSPSVGYRFDYKGRSVVISGDTAKSPSLIATAKGADLLVHEALQPKMVAMMTKALDAKGIKNTAQITRDILDYHASPEEAAESAKAAGVKQLVLSHIVPPLPSAFFYPAFLGDAGKRFSGPIVVGEDGMLFSLPVGSKEISQRDLL